LSGVAFDGPRKGSALKPIPTIETDWGYWLKAYPKTVAYHMFDKYTAHKPPSAVTAESVATRGPIDRRLPADERVIGISVGNSAKAYPVSLLATNPVIRDIVGGRELVVLWYASTRSAAIYEPRMEDENVPARLKLEHNPQIPTAPFMDKETFSHWTIEGRAVEGPLKGKALVWLPGVQCKWFAWAAEYPETKIYSSAEKIAEASEPMAARLIAGERLDWDKLVKATGCLIKINRAAQSVTVLTDFDKKEHFVQMTPQTEFHVEGAWGDLENFRPNQNVYLILAKNEKGEVSIAHALADEISMQSMSRPYLVREQDREKGWLRLVDEQSRNPVVNLEITGETKQLARRSDIQTGDKYYFNSTRSGSSARALALMDEPNFQAHRHERLLAHRKAVKKYGMLATVLDSDAANNCVTLLVRRSDAWYARWLKPNDIVELKVDPSEKVSCKIVEARPDYSRIRVRLNLGAFHIPAVQPGQSAAMFAEIPAQTSFDTPPDLGRFIKRQDRIDYFMSTIYCPCGMIGNSCAGHWNTLAACKLHGCGMPNLITKFVGEQIDAGKSDEAILAELVERNGEKVLKLHQN